MALQSKVEDMLLELGMLGLSLDQLHHAYKKLAFWKWLSIMKVWSPSCSTKI